ncbi:A24 family peptidase [Streptomyces sp. ST2-7A]|uniref:prepilin peptidase n=1 Tax=Streptomyces sp. ST2-7A TaxID=2907214 RepID=UPI001F32CDB3|nr:A24 family peptidase [Streptomyces sp. ST2-7A]MCE7082110.1 A24 family peptidase [Streptomyces sp. ST2-7A]
MHPVLFVTAALFGAVTGALTPRAVHRLSVPPGESWRSTAPDGEPLPAGPRGWIGTRPGAGPARPALVGAVCAALLAAACGPVPETVVWLLLLPGAMVLAAVDIAVLRLPDVLTLPLAALAVVGTGIAALLPGAQGSWLRAVVAAAVLAAVFFVMALISPAGMGLGDVKLAPALGAALGWYGWDVLLTGVFAGFLLAACYALFLVAAKGAGRRTEFCMGPFLALGALVGVVIGGLAV